MIAGVAGCANPGMPICGPDEGSPVRVFSLFFGLSIQGRGEVTDREWQRFLDDTITANLPNGYTVVDAHGAWMNPITRRTIEERTKVLLVALPVAPEAEAAVNRIRSEYQIRFRQQLVGMTVSRACGAF